MLAKSARDLSHGAYAGKIGGRTRSAVSLLVLIASLTAFALIVRDQYGVTFHGGSLNTILPFNMFDADKVDAESASGDMQSVGVDPNERRYRALAEFLARKYRVSEDVTFDLVGFAHAAGHQLGLDPLLIIAVIAVESRFNPIAESLSGAKGLMQVIPKYHSDKLEEFGGEKAVFDPQTNILVGSQILKEYLRRTGDMNAALQMYAGELDDQQDGYTTKVMSEKQRLQQVVSRSAKSKSVKAASRVRVAEAHAAER